MKKYSLILFILILLPFVYAETCYDCLLDSKVLFSMHSLYGGDNYIKYKDDVVSYNNYILPEETEFLISYTPEDKILTYIIGENVQQIKIDGDDNFKNIIITAQTSYYGGNSIEFKEMYLNSKRIDDLFVENGIYGAKYSLKNKYFTLTGKIKIKAEENTNRNIVGVNFYLATGKGSGKKVTIESYNTDSNELDNGNINLNGDVQEIPEFTTITTILTLIGVSLIFLKRK
ncbi:MAG: hypothetical protein QXL18_03030 [Candidatus Woesearchaeota archaeon]